MQIRRICMYCRGALSGSQRLLDGHPADVHPKLSIVIRNWNYGCFLRAAIDSALAQTHAGPKSLSWMTARPTIPAVLADYGDRVRAVLKENGGERNAVNEARKN